MSTLSSPSWRSRQQVAGPRLSTPVLPTWQQSLSSIPQVCLSIYVLALVVPPALTDLHHSSTLWWFPCWIPWYTVWGTKKSKMPWEGCKRRVGIAEATDSEISDGFFLSESPYTITFLWMKYNKRHTAFRPRKLNLTHNIPKWINSWIMLHKQYFYILGPHYFQPTWREASSFIDTSTSICETLEFSALLLLFRFWEGALFHLGLLTLKERQLTEASGVCKPRLPDILTQHNLDVVVASVFSVFLMRMYAEREHSFGQKQVYYWPDWASLVVQLVKSLPAMRETWVWSLGQKDPLEEGMATHSSILAWRIPMDRGSDHGLASYSP